MFCIISHYSLKKKKKKRGKQKGTDLYTLACTLSILIEMIQNPFCTDA